MTSAVAASHPRRRAQGNDAAALPAPPLALALAMGLALALSAAPSAAEASSCFESGEVIVEADETLRCDLVVLPGSLLVKEGGRIVGSANVPAGSANVRGEVTGDVFVLRELVVAGGVGGSATAMLGDLLLEGEVGGDLTAGGDLEIRGVLGGDASASGDIVLAEGASLAADSSLSVGGEILDDSGGSLDYEQPEGKAGSDTASLLLLALAMVAFATVFASLATAAVPEAVANARAASERSLALTTFLGLAFGLVLLVAAWLVIPAIVAMLATAVGGVGLSERLGARFAREWGRMAQSAIGALLLAALAAGLMLLGAGHPVRLCIVSLPLALLGAAALGPGLVTHFGRRAWQPSPRTEDDPDSVPLDEDVSPERDVPALADPPRTSRTPGAEAPGEYADEDVYEDGDDNADEEVYEDEDGAEAGSEEPLPEVSLGAPPIDAGEIVLEPAPAPAPAPKPEPSERLEAEARAAEAIGALRRVPGVTPIYAELLRAAGVSSLADLAAMSPKALLDVASAPGVLPIDLETAARWLRDARELSQGGPPA